MAITVQHGKDEVTTHHASSKWHIDERGRLHIVGENGNTASYNEGYWANVSIDESGEIDPNSTCPSICAAANHPGSEH